MESASFHLRVAQGSAWAMEGGKQARVWQGGDLSPEKSLPSRL